jgi:hypothetical protein
MKKRIKEFKCWLLGHKPQHNAEHRYTVHGRHYITAFGYCERCENQLLGSHQKYTHSEEYYWVYIIKR